ncbi:hypothetical protein GW17_00060390 [Ensete ventricosum]|nr:hypothetical protein GW17_00060390 [Ensete ventricosum]
MRLNRVESFYVFLLYFRNEGSPCRGQPGLATASPLAGAAGCSQGPHAKGRLAAARPPAKGRPAAAMANPQGGGGSRPRVAGCSAAPARGDSRQRPCRRGCRRLPVASPQRAVDCRFDARRKATCEQRSCPQGLPPARATASSGCGSTCKGGARGGASHRGGRPLAEWLLADKGSRRLRRGSSDNDGTVRVKEG